MVGAAYDSLGYDGFHDWPLLQDRYTLAVLFEYAAALALAAPGVPEPERAMRALRLLKAGRAVLLSQALETRDDLSDLRRSHPSRAPRRSWSRPVAHP